MHRQAEKVVATYSASQDDNVVVTCFFKLHVIASKPMTEPENELKRVIVKFKGSGNTYELVKYALFFQKSNT